MSRQRFDYTYISLSSFLAEWADINNGLVQLSRQCFEEHPFAMVRAPSSPSSLASSSTSSGAAACAESAFTLYGKVYHLLAGLGPVRGDADLDPAADVEQRFQAMYGSPISPYAGAARLADGAAELSSEHELQNSAATGQRLDPSRSASSTAHGKPHGVPVWRSSPLSTSSASLCVYSRLELLLRLVQLTDWLWVALMARATGGRMRLPPDVADALQHIGRQSSSPVSMFAMDMGSESDRARWASALRLTVVSWLGEERVAAASAETGIRRRRSADDDDDGDFSCFAAAHFLCPAAAVSGCAAPGSDGVSLAESAAASPHTESAVTAEELVAVHALVAVSQHYARFAQNTESAFMRLSRVLTECTPRDVNGGQPPVGPRSHEQHSGPAESRCPPSFPSSLSMWLSSRSSRVVHQEEETAAALILSRTMQRTLHFNEAWVCAAMRTAVRATLGREDDALALLLSSAPATPLAVPLGSGECSAGDCEVSASRTRLSPPHAFAALVQYVEACDLKNMFMVDAMVERARADSLRAWTTRVVEQCCWRRGRRLLSTALAAAMPTLVHADGARAAAAAAAATPAAVSGVEMDGASSAAQVSSTAAEDAAREAAAELLAEAVSACSPPVGPVHARAPAAREDSHRQRRQRSSAAGHSSTVARPDEDAAGSGGGVDWDSCPYAPSASLQRRVGQAIRALRDCLNAYVRLRAALLLFGSGTTRYMERLTPCGQQRLLAGLRAFADGLFSPGEEGPPAKYFSDETLSTARHVGAAAPSCDMRQFTLVFGLSLWLQLSERVGGKTVRVPGPGASPSASTAAEEAGEKGNCSPGAPSRRTKSQSPVSSPSTAARLPLVMEVPAAGAAAAEEKEEELPPGAAESTAAGTDARSFADAVSDATSAHLAQERREWLQSVLGVEDDWAAEARRLHFIAALPEDGLPTLLYLLSGSTETRWRRPVLAAFRTQVQLFFAGLLQTATSAPSGPASLLQPLPPAVFQRCVVSLHTAQTAFTGQDVVDVATEYSSDTLTDPSLPALASLAATAVCKGLQAFFAGCEQRAALTLARALHAQVTRRTRTRARARARGTPTAVASTVVDTLLVLASILPSPETFVLQYSCLLAPRLTQVKSAEALATDDVVVAHMEQRLGAAVVHPCTKLLADLRSALSSTRGVESDVLRSPPLPRRARTKHRAVADRRRESDDDDGDGDYESVSVSVRGVDESADALSTALPASLASAARAAATLLPVSLTAGARRGPSRSPVAYALSLLGSGTALPRAPVSASSRMETDEAASRAAAHAPRFIRHLRVLCQAWWAPFLGVTTSSDSIVRLREQPRPLRAPRRTRQPAAVAFFTEDVVDAVLRTEWCYCDPSTATQSARTRGGGGGGGGGSHDGTPESPLARPFPGYGRRYGIPSSTALLARLQANGMHQRLCSYGSGSAAADDGQLSDSPGLLGENGSARSPSLLSLPSVFARTVVQPGSSLVDNLRGAEYRSGAFGNDEPDDADSDADFRAAYGGVLDAAGGPSTRQRADERSLSSLAPSPLHGPAPSPHGGDDSASARGSPLQTPALEHRLMRWPLCAGQMVFRIHPRHRGPVDSVDGAVDVAGPPITLLVVQLLDAVSAAPPAAHGEGLHAMQQGREEVDGGETPGASLDWLCAHMPLRTPRAVVGAVLKALLLARLVQRHRRRAGSEDVAYALLDRFACAGGQPARVTVDLVPVLQSLAALAAVRAEEADGDRSSRHDGDDLHAGAATTVVAAPAQSTASLGVADDAADASARQRGDSTAAPDAAPLSSPEQQQQQQSSSFAHAHGDERRLLARAESHIVAVLKHAGRMPHAALAASVAHALAPVPRAQATVVFKRAMSHLLEREYLRREEGETAYSYVA